MDVGRLEGEDCHRNIADAMADVGEEGQDLGDLVRETVWERKRHLDAPVSTGALSGCVFQDGALDLLHGLAKVNSYCEICASGTFFGSKELHSRGLLPEHWGFTSDDPY